MTFRLSHIEFWLLDLVQEWGDSINGTANGNYGNNKKFYPYSISELAEAYERLSAEGWIIGYGVQRNPKDLTLTREQIRFELMRDDIKQDTPSNSPEIFYRLTSSGGQVWEAFAHPRWDQYIDGYFEACEGDHPALLEATCLSREYLQAEFELSAADGIESIPESIIWSEVKPWDVFYWKTLSLGYRVQYQIKRPKKVSWPRTHYRHLQNRSWIGCRP